MTPEVRQPETGVVGTSGPPIRPWRDAAVATLVVLTVSTGSLAVTYYFARHAVIESVQRGLLQVARLAAAGVDVAAHQRLTDASMEGNADYLRIATGLAAVMKQVPEVFYLYTLVPTAPGKYVYGVDTAAVHQVPGDLTDRLPLRGRYEVPDADLDRSVATGRPQVATETWSLPGRRFLSAFAPFHDATGAVAGVVEADMWIHTLDARLDRLLTMVETAFAGLVVMSLAVGALTLRQRTHAATAECRDRAAVQALAEARDAAEAASRAKSEFLATMSHELRTPLNAIVGYSELLHEEFAETGDVELSRDAERISAASRHLAGIIGDILDHSTLDDGRLTLAPQPVDVPDLVHDLVELLRPSAAARGLTLIVDVRPATARVVADPIRLRQALLNLIGNAVKFTERGGIVVRVRRADHAGHVVCVVYDSGIGISREQLGRLFEPFAQVDASSARAAAGTGLGLTISRRLVEAMGGTLTVRSRPGRGSAFRLTLPSDLAQGRAA